MIRRLPQIAFGLLALATVAAFFLVQALKTEPPLLWGPPSPIPSAINPVGGRTCLNSKGASLSYRQATLNVSVHNDETVGVYIVNANDPAGNNIATVSSGTPIVASQFPGQHSHLFTWNGRLAGGQTAPPGTYYFRVVLQPHDRSINLSKTPVQVITQPPPARILSVRPIGASGAGAGGSGTTTGPHGATGTITGAATTGGAGRSPGVSGPAVIAPPRGGVRITWTRWDYRRVTLDIYRTDVSGAPELVDTLGVDRHPVSRLGRNWATWNGRINGAPAPAGTYLVGISAQDMACNRTSWPSIPPRAGSTAHAGVTVRYLSVTPPLVPTASGARARVSVDSAAPVTWRLRVAGSRHVVAHGRGPAGPTTLAVRLPRRRPGLYALEVRAGDQTATAPLVADQAGAAAAHARVLVVLPMLSWMGDSPVDDTGDGLPQTLGAGDSVALNRPLVDGPPNGFAGDATLLGYLSARHLSYQLTTDVALAEGVGPSLAGRGGVVLPEGEAYLPAGLAPILRRFVAGGGRALTIGMRTLRGVSPITGFPSAPRAGAPRATRTDPFGARRGPVTPTGGALITAFTDGLGLFNGAGTFAGVNRVQPITAPAPPSGSTSSGPVSAAGIGGGATAIVAFHDGNGTVVEVALAGFASSLAGDADAQTLIGNAWQLLSQ
ncbi:MAG TPA: hypothetical protein VFN36_06940 [Solirubrobacteraceae bacterium]|nr:hypothetical protein [Solirubrobacteraceae bacterium]